MDTRNKNKSNKNEESTSEVNMDDFGRFDASSILDASVFDMLDMVYGGSDNMGCANVFKCS